MTDMDDLTFAKLIAAVVENDTGERDYRISELASEFGITHRTLRYYESLGLLNPTRQGATRLFSAKDRRILCIVILWKQLGFSLVEARNFLAVVNQPKPSRHRIRAALDLINAQEPLLLERKREVENSLAALAAARRDLAAELETGGMVASLD